ncbi:MAG: hypothetical protein ACHQ53_16415 [Polyangiales bacterium]
MSIGRSRRAVIRLGVCALMVAAGSSVWQLLAAQAPGTPLYIGMLEGPVAALRGLATSIGLVLFAAAWLLPWAFPEREPKRLVALLYVGTVLGLGGEIYGAVRGMFGMQLADMRPDALPLFIVKHLGLGLLLGALLDLGRRVLLRPPPN